MSDEKNSSSATIRTMKNSTRLIEEKNNPCVQEHELSLKCLKDNNYDNMACAKQFTNYTTCKQFWKIIGKYRKRDGIFPALPEPDDRKRIKEDYMKNRHTQNHKPIYY